VDVKRFTKFAVAALIFGSAAYVFVGSARAAVVAAERDTTRAVSGTVLSKNDAALSGAVVYLKNTKSLTVKSYIADANGQFRFSSLSTNVDYEIYAEYNGVRSGTKTVSAFDSRKNVQLTLHVDVTK
jgi:hypothetical protein